VPDHDDDDDDGDVYHDDGVDDDDDLDGGVKDDNGHKKNLHGPSPRANYTDRATAASRGSGCQLLRIKGATWSA
jgi:hypothetical protein